nr:putative ribonuclease H-like domain-containing protein [Tanacetum cinerariifolium]
TKNQPQKHIVPTVVLTKSKPVSVTAARPVSVAVPKIMVTKPRHAHSLHTKLNSIIRRHKTHSRSSKTSNSSSKVTVVKALVVSVVKGKKGKWVWKPKCSILEHDSRTTGNMSYLSDFQELNGGYITFGGNPKGGKISGKGKIKTGKLDFEDVYFVKELKFNLFSVSQMCDKKNKVLFTDSECLVLSPDFKLSNESQVLLRVPRENNMYNVNLKDIPSGDLTCLFAKATIDESNLWHRRLGHINFKTINKLVKGNLVRGLSIKVFENSNTCVACKKGKQHRASCKTKPVSFVNQPLFRLHMDLFGPTFVKILNKKCYCLVIIDDYSRFTWVFFLATKDETSPILKTFITGLENQLSLKVKVIKSDNGTEFKNSDLNQFCELKGIKREFSVPRTPQQNGIAERKNRTLIEAARTMLADLLLPIPFWTEAVNTACYVQNRVLVTKPQNKTPYELLQGRTPSIGFMRPFGCPMTILNTLDPLGTGPTWLFDIDSLTRTMNYQPVTAGNQSNPNAGFHKEIATEKAGEEATQQYMLFHVWSTGSLNPQNKEGDAAFDGKEQDAEKPESAVNLSLNSSAQSGRQDDMTKKKDKGKSPVEYFTGNRDLYVDFEDYSEDSSNDVSAASPIVPTAGEDIAYSDHENVGAEADFNNLETSITISPIPTTRTNKDHPVAQIIGDLSSTTQTRCMTRVIRDPVARIEAIRLFLAYASFMGFMVYQMDVKSAFIKEKVYVCQHLGFEDPDHLDKVYKVVKALYGLDQAPRAWYETLANYLLENGFHRGKNRLNTLHQEAESRYTACVNLWKLTFFLGLQVKQKEDGIFISQDKYVAEILKKFGLTEGKLASTPIDTKKPLLKDPDGEDVDVHIYRSMIGSLMYLTSSKLDIMFVVCACARFQADSKNLLDMVSSSKRRVLLAQKC